MKVLSVVNQKGGVGKTTTTIELASCLALSDYRVLVIDLDQQCNASKYADANLSKPNIYQVLNAEKSIDEAIQTIDNSINKNNHSSFDFIIASEELSKADRTFTDYDDIYLLHDVIDIVKDKYDFILIDNCPSRNITMTMSYYAADYIIAPTDCDEGSTDGIDRVYTDIDKLRANKHGAITAKMLCIILTKYEHTAMHQTALDALKESAAANKDNPSVFVVRKSIISSECKTFRRSMQIYQYYSNPASDYRKIVDDITQKMEEQI